MKTLALMSVLVLALYLACTLWGSREARLQGYDVLASPGEGVRLRAKLEREGPILLQKDIGGRLVYFYHGGKLLGAAATDDQGWADLDYKVSADAGSGNLRVSCRLDQADEYHAPPADILVVVREKDTPILVTDIDHTIADVSSGKFLIKSNEKVPTIPGAPEVLGRLAERYLIVYVTARDDTFMRKTKKWLRLRNFPEGPALFWDLGGKPYHSEDFKAETIRDLRKRFPNVLVGVGDKASDVNAYLANGMRAFLIGNVRPKEMPEDAEFVRSWEEVEQKLK